MILITKKKRPTRIMLWITPSLASVWKTRIKIKSALHMTWIFPDYYVEKLFNVQFQEFPKGQKKKPRIFQCDFRKKNVLIRAKQFRVNRRKIERINLTHFPFNDFHCSSRTTISKKNRQKVMETRTCDRE